jgi:HK97 gp10 family phage protein
MSRADVHLEGFKDLEKNMRGLRGFVNSKQVVEGLHDGVKVMGRIAKNKAPKGPTGNLKRAIRTGIFRKQKRGSPAVFMGIDYRRGPHAHLVEYGTKRRIPRKYSVLKFEIDGQIIYVRRVGPMPAKPFWRPAVDIGKNAAGRVASKKIAREIEREVVRKKMHRYATLI